MSIYFDCTLSSAKKTFQSPSLKKATQLTLENITVLGHLEFGPKFFEQT